MTATNAEPSGAEGANETAGAATNAPVNVLPIQFQDVPITTAIENLARLAGINYLLDPKIGYGQPDQNGQVKPEPTISVRWENVSARQALLAVLDNYNLQLTEDPKTKIGRISIKNPNAPPPLITRVIQLKYASVSNMISSGKRADRQAEQGGGLIRVPANWSWSPPKASRTRWTRWLSSWTNPPARF